MGITNIIDIAGSGMNAQSVRLNTTASNIANAESASTSSEGTYRGRQAVFAATYQNFLGHPEPSNFAADDASVGVNVTGIVESDAPLQRRYEPGHPLADEQGYVFYPNVNVVEEMTNMISASRSFQVNVEVMSSAKQMVQKILTLGE
jgi:flagellar basal-body rod protein FlgC